MNRMIDHKDSAIESAFFWVLGAIAAIGLAGTLISTAPNR